jgi:hypothetical protein
MPISMLPVLEKLEYLKMELKSWQTVATALGCDRAFIWDVLNGRRDAGPKLLKALYFEKRCELVDLDPERVELAKLARRSR